MGSEVQIAGKTEAEIEKETGADNALEMTGENDGAEIQGSKPARMVGTTTRRGRSRQPPHATAGHRPAPLLTYRPSAGLCVFFVFFFRSFIFSFVLPLYCNGIPIAFAFLKIYWCGPDKKRGDNFFDDFSPFDFGNFTTRF